jgi:Flp pilus assembly protein TadD
LTSPILFKKASAILAYISKYKLESEMKQESDKVLKDATELCQDERELEAEVLVKEQLAADPDNLDLMTKLGVIQARLCNDHEAENTFRAVLVRDPDHEDAVCGLGRLLDQALKTDEAEQIYRDFIQNNPIGHCALEDLCRLLLAEERVVEAIRLARNQVEQYGDTPSAYDALRYLLHELEDRLEAELNDDRENETLFTQLLNNLFYQLEVVIKIENLGKQADDLQTELEDDKTRLVGELEHLLNSAPSRQVKVPSDLQKKIQSKLRNTTRDR